MALLFSKITKYQRPWSCYFLHFHIICYWYHAVQAWETSSRFLGWVAWNRDPAVALKLEHQAPDDKPRGLAILLPGYSKFFLRTSQSPSKALRASAKHLFECESFEVRVSASEWNKRAICVLNSEDLLCISGRTNSRKHLTANTARHPRFRSLRSTSKYHSPKSAP